MSQSDEEIAAPPRAARARKRAPKPEGLREESEREATAETTETADRQKGARAAGETVGRDTAEATARAEVMLDQTGQRLGHWLSDAGHRLRIFGARAREEAEDIWAEAQSVRHHEES